MVLSLPLPLLFSVISVIDDGKWHKQRQRQHRKLVWKNWTNRLTQFFFLHSLFLYCFLLLKRMFIRKKRWEWSRERKSERRRTNDIHIHIEKHRQTYTCTHLHRYDIQKSGPIHICTHSRAHTLTYERIHIFVSIFFISCFHLMNTKFQPIQIKLICATNTQVKSTLTVRVCVCLCALFNR